MGKNNLTMAIILFGLIPLLALGTVSTINSNVTPLNSTQLSTSQSITIMTPTSSTSWQAGTSYYIQWTSSGASSYVDIYLYDSGYYYSTIASGTSNDGSYSWSIPSSVPADDYYQIVIEDYYDSSIYDYSAAYFSITGSITVTTPTSATSWQAGTSHYIYWTSAGASSYVDIYLYDSGYYYSTIATYTSNDGIYYWSIPSSVLADDYYQIVIEDYYDSSIYDYSAAYFSITGSITVTTPTSATSWQRGSSHYIYWTSSGCSSYVTIELYKDGYYYSTIASSTSNDGTYSWYISSSQTTSDYYQIKIEDYYDSSLYDYSAAYFSITSACSITVSTPSSSTSWQRGSSHYIYWTSSGCSSYVTIELYKDGYYYSTIVYSTSNDGSYYWSIPSSLPVGATYEVKIEDYYTSSYYDYSSYFTITGAGIPGFTWGFVLLGIIMLLSMLKIMVQKKRNSHLFSP